MSNLFLKPAVDAETGEPKHVRDPQTQAPLKAEGEWKSRSSYWTRRIRDGEVIISEPSIEPARTLEREAPEPAPIAR